MYIHCKVGFTTYSYGCGLLRSHRGSSIGLSGHLGRRHGRCNRPLSSYRTSGYSYWPGIYLGGYSRYSSILLVSPRHPPSTVIRLLLWGCCRSRSYGRGLAVGTFCCSLSVGWLSHGSYGRSSIYRFGYYGSLYSRLSHASRSIYP